MTFILIKPESLTPNITFPEKIFSKETVQDQEMTSTKSKDFLAIEEIYPDVITGDLGTVLSLLSKSINFVNEAVVCYDNSIIESDEYIQHFQALLPDLFYFREIGEGFGIVISSLMAAFINQKGIPLEKAQIILVREIITKIKKEPFIKTMQAVELCDEMEEKSFNLDNISNHIHTVIDEIIP